MEFYFSQFYQAVSQGGGKHRGVPPLFSQSCSLWACRLDCSAMLAVAGGPIWATMSSEQHALVPDTPDEDLSLAVRLAVYTSSGVRRTSDEEIYVFRIPQTAAASFMQDCPKYVDGCQVLNNADQHQAIKAPRSEGCFHRGHELGLPVATFVREPRRHVISQYHHCRRSPDHSYASDLMPDSIDEWVRAWAQSTPDDTAALVAAPVCDPKGGGRKAVSRFSQSKTPFCCYFPWNLQTQHLTCTQPLGKHPWTASRELSRALPQLNLTRALENALSTRFVGLAEAPQESVCLFVALAAGVQRIPTFCDCEDQSVWAQFSSTNETHGNYEHPQPNDLPKDVLDLIDLMTYKDRQVYDAMRMRFLEDIESVEKSSGKRILCEDARKRLSEL